jgi:hypothetical protein
VLLYEGDNVDATRSVTMMKKLDKVINAKLKCHMDNNKKSCIEDVLLDFTADNNVSVQIEGTDVFQSLDHVLMDC